jgi:HAD superfamily hydrolase (TIGR01549 family)
VKPNTYIVLDFDGTIADTIDHALTIYNNIAQEYACKPISEEDKKGISLHQSKEVLETYGITKLKLLLLSLRIRKEMGKQMSAITPVEGIKESFQALKNSGYRLGILTSNSVSNVSLFMKSNGLADMIDFIYSGKSLFGKDKVMAHMFEKEGLSKKDVIYVGDEKRDIEACKKVGIPIIAVTWGISDSTTLENLHPDKIAYTPGELLPCIQQLSL